MVNVSTYGTRCINLWPWQQTYTYILKFFINHEVSGLSYGDSKNYLHTCIGDYSLSAVKTHPLKSKIDTFY